METPGTTPIGAVPAAELDDLAAVFRGAAPFVSLYLAADPDEADAPHRLEVRWQNARRDLAGAGIAGELLDELERAVLADAHGGATVAVIADAHGVRLVERLPEPPRREVAAVAALPRLGPIVEWRQSIVPHVVVLADRTGADLVAFAGPDEVASDVAGGGGGPIRKVQAGGWSMRRFQERAENTWQDNAQDVAASVQGMVERVDAQLVVVAGDPRAVQLLRSALPPQVDALVHVVDGGRGRDGSAGAVAAETTTLAATATAAQSVALLRKLREERGQDDRAAVGVDDVLAALAAGQVEVLLLHDDPDDDRSAWFGPQLAQLGRDPGTVAAMGVDEPEQGRLADVLLRGALGTGASVRYVPDVASLPDGVGAILRWA